MYTNSEGVKSHNERCCSDAQHTLHKLKMKVVYIYSNCDSKEKVYASMFMWFHILSYYIEDVMRHNNIDIILSILYLYTTAPSISLIMYEMMCNITQYIASKHNNNIVLPYYDYYYTAKYFVNTYYIGTAMRHIIILSVNAI